MDIYDLKVRSKVSEHDVRSGFVYSARAVGGDVGPEDVAFYVLDDVGESWPLYSSEAEVVPTNTPLSRAVRSLIIYDSFGQDHIKFRLVDGDYSDLNHVYGNAAGNTQEQDDRINSVLFDSEWNTHPDFSTVMPKLDDNTVVVVTGFLP